MLVLSHNKKIIMNRTKSLFLRTEFAIFVSFVCCVQQKYTKTMNTRSKAKSKSQSMSTSSETKQSKQSEKRKSAATAPKAKQAKKPSTYKTIGEFREKVLEQRARALGIGESNFCFRHAFTEEDWVDSEELSDEADEEVRPKLRAILCCEKKK